MRQTSTHIVLQTSKLSQWLVTVNIARILKPKKTMFLATIKSKFFSGNNGYLNFDYQNVLSVLGMEN